LIKKGNLNTSVIDNKIEEATRKMNEAHDDSMKLLKEELERLRENKMAKGGDVKQPLTITSTSDTTAIEDAKKIAMRHSHLLKEGEYVIVRGDSYPKRFKKEGDDLVFIRTEYSKGSSMATGGGVGKTIKINNEYNIKVLTKETGSNYNKFASIFRKGEKSPIAGTSFRDTSTDEEILNWGKKIISGGSMETGSSMSRGGIYGEKKIAYKGFTIYKHPTNAEIKGYGSSGTFFQSGDIVTIEQAKQVIDLALDEKNIPKVKTVFPNANDIHKRIVYFSDNRHNKNLPKVNPFLSAKGSSMATGGGVDDYTKNLGLVEVEFENPLYNYSTNVSGTTTEKGARDYFVGKTFNVGAYPKEIMAKVIDIKFYPKGTYAKGGGVGDNQKVWIVNISMPGQRAGDFKLRKEEIILGRMSDEFDVQQAIKRKSPDWLGNGKVLSIVQKRATGGGIGKQTSGISWIITGTSI